uniref:Uncharacterized protein n=1 Tax=Romanomermis culicivorax TaxID=13658 RepID=A0A915I2U7_ROMCU
MDGVRHSTSLHKATLVWRNIDNPAEPRVEDRLQHLHHMAEEADWPNNLKPSPIYLALAPFHFVSWMHAISMRRALRASPSSRLHPVIVPTLIVPSRIKKRFLQ